MQKGTVEKDFRSMMANQKALKKWTNRTTYKFKTFGLQKTVNS